MTFCSGLLVVHPLAIGEAFRRLLAVLDQDNGREIMALPFVVIHVDRDIPIIPHIDDVCAAGLVVADVHPGSGAIARAEIDDAADGGGDHAGFSQTESAISRSSFCPDGPTASRSRSAKPIKGQSWRMQSS